ncbi:MAG: electron transfer flavoprotein subunit beta/FixA family protein [Nitrospinae bacterium]|nr:electron transfer flavoprotein subunit beta/FixA family protein [Nitrospinota bacterium]
MNIVVCVKQVLDTAARIRITDGQVDAQGIPRIMNPYDEYAAEEALLIREKNPGATISLISAGPEPFRDTLKTGLAMGADKAIHLMDPAFEGLDNLGIARVLAKAIQTLPFDLILCGRQAVDDDMAQVGPALAALLGIPFAATVTKLVLGPPDGAGKVQATVTRQIEGGSETLSAALPLLLTCQKGLNVPRLPSLKGIMAAKKKEVTVLDAKAIGFDPQTMGAGANRVRQAGLSLPPSRKKGRMLEGPQAALQLAQILREEEKLI